MTPTTPAEQAKTIAVKANIIADEAEEDAERADERATRREAEATEARAKATSARERATETNANREPMKPQPYDTAEEVIDAMQRAERSISPEKRVDNREDGGEEASRLYHRIRVSVRAGITDGTRLILDDCWSQWEQHPEGEACEMGTDITADNHDGIVSQIHAWLANGMDAPSEETDAIPAKHHE